jgi:hypothetical protein
MHAQIPQDGPDEFGDDVGLLPQWGQLNLLSASRNQLAGLQYQLVGWHDVDGIAVPAKLLRIPASDRDACADGDAPTRPPQCRSPRSATSLNHSATDCGVACGVVDPQ